MNPHGCKRVDIRKCLKAAGAAALFLACISNAHAGTPTLISTEPAEPRAGQSFELVYTLEFCGDLFPGYNQTNRITQLTGNTLQVIVPYASQACFPGQQYPPVYRWQIGPLAAGTYHLELRGYPDIGDPQDSFVISSSELHIVPPFVAASPNVVPATGKLGLACLVVIIALIALHMSRRL